MEPAIFVSSNKAAIVAAAYMATHKSVQRCTVEVHRRRGCIIGYNLRMHYANGSDLMRENMV